jgi:uncharacterized protein (DUF1778 family)
MSGRGMQPVYTQSVTIEIRAFPPQADKWRAAAAVHGHNVEGWIVSVADRAAREVARNRGKAKPLYWRWDYFIVSLMDRSVRPEKLADWRVRGEVSGFFGIFRGDGKGIGKPGCCRFSIVHLPSRRIIGTLPLRKAARVLASELAALQCNWRETDPQKVLLDTPGQKKAQELLQNFDTLTRGVNG